MKEEISNMHSFLHWLLVHWQFTLLVLGSIAGAFIWWMHATFASKDSMENCRLDMVDNYDKKMDRYHSENKAEHKELRTDIKSILAHLLDRD